MSEVQKEAGVEMQRQDCCHLTCAGPSKASMGGSAHHHADTAFDQWYAAQCHQLSNEQVCRLIWQRGWEAATRRAAAICRSVNNYDNPMTAGDCADEIAKGIGQ